MRKAKAAFTLIEVMIAVVIISTVIMALITMNGNNKYTFSLYKDKTKINQYASFFIANPDYGFEDKRLHLDDLLSEFDVETDLRRNLKNIKVELKYQEMERIDMSEFDEDEQQEQDDADNQEAKGVNSQLIIEIGKTTLNIDGTSISLLRIQVP